MLRIHLCVLSVLARLTAAISDAPTPTAAKACKPSIKYTADFEGLDNFSPPPTSYGGATFGSFNTENQVLFYVLETDWYDAFFNYHITPSSGENVLYQSDTSPFWLQLNTSEPNVANGYPLTNLFLHGFSFACTLGNPQGNDVPSECTLLVVAVDAWDGKGTRTFKFKYAPPDGYVYPADAPMKKVSLGVGATRFYFMLGAIGDGAPGLFIDDMVWDQPNPKC